MTFAAVRSASDHGEARAVFLRSGGRAPGLLRDAALLAAMPFAPLHAAGTSAEEVFHGPQGADVVNVSTGDAVEFSRSR